MIAVGLLASVCPAAARPLGYYGAAPPVEIRRGYPVDALPTPFSNGGSCIKACPTDETPCDPDYWKVADRRCNLSQGLS